MTQETYRFAYEEANAELREILGHGAGCRCLKIVLSGEAPTESMANFAAEQVPFLVHHQTIEVTTQELKNEPAPEPEFEPEPAFAEQSSDPFQRRIDMALRHGLGTRESRVLPRGLNGLLSRA